MLVHRPLLPSMDCFHGDNHELLCDRIKSEVFKAALQNRHVVAVVQSFGYGKMKTTQRMTDRFIVLPLRLSKSHRVLHMIQDAQVMLRNQLVVVDVNSISQQCFATVELALQSLVHALHRCTKFGLIKLTESADRFLFVTCAIQDHEDKLDTILRLAEECFWQQFPDLVNKCAWKVSSYVKSLILSCRKIAPQILCFWSTNFTSFKDAASAAVCTGRTRPTSLSTIL